MRHIHAIMHYLCICSADLAIMHVGQIQAGFLMHIVLGVGVVNPSSNSRGGLSGAKRPFPINLSVRPYVIIHLDRCATIALRSNWFPAVFSKFVNFVLITK